MGVDCAARQVVLLRSSDNHMDPCFRFPWHDLQDLFATATVTEAMLVALDHMQVNFVTIASTGLRKFRRNTSFPQDVPRFAEKLDLMKGYRVNDRVNSARGLGDDPRNPDREVRRATAATHEEREKYCVDAGGCLVFPGRVVEVRTDGNTKQPPASNTILLALLVRGSRRAAHFSIWVPWIIAQSARRVHTIVDSVPLHQIQLLCKSRHVLRERRIPSELPQPSRRDRHEVHLHVVERHEHRLRHRRCRKQILQIMPRETEARIHVIIR
jgi:hypothetical protein